MCILLAGLLNMHGGNGGLFVRFLDSMDLDRLSLELFISRSSKLDASLEGDLAVEYVGTDGILDGFSKYRY